MSAAQGPLAGVRVLEFAAIGPCTHCGMLLSDMGAEVVVIDRPGHGQDGLFPREERFRIDRRGRTVLGLDLKNEEGRGAALALATDADILIEGFRPGTMERLGLGPAQCEEVNDRLIYGRLTGWGQDGPMSAMAGHDINYLAASGLLDAIGRPGAAPTVPLNVVGDYGGGSMLLAFGLACALHERNRSGKGQVIDAAMTDGISLLCAGVRGLGAAGQWREDRGDNLFDGGAPWYDVYPAADARFLAVGALEEKFYREFVTGLGLSMSELPARGDRRNWPALRTVFASRIASATLSHWVTVFEGRDACVTPVMTLDQATRYPQFTARAAFEQRDGVWHPQPAPRFSRTPGRIQPNGPSGARLRSTDNEARSEAPVQQE